MSLERAYFGNLKTKKYMNLHLHPNNNKNIFPKYSNKGKIIFRNDFRNDLIKKTNTYNYKNNITTINSNKNNIKKNNISSTNCDINKKNNNKNNNNKKKNIKINTTYNPAITNTTIESTITSPTQKGAKKTEPFFYEPNNKDSLNTLELDVDSNKKIKEPESEDIKFLYTIFYNNNSIKNNLYESKNKNKHNKYNLNDLRKYIIINETNFKREGNILLYQSSRGSKLVPDFYFIKKFEGLIARFSLIIFIFIQSERLNQAREIFLLMLKENKVYLDYIEQRITEYYKISNKRINIAKEYPRMTYEIIRIYSFIIKYSQFFNMMNYRNIFMGRYFELLFFIYNFFIHKGNNRMFNLETKNQLNYWFSFALHNASYYSALNYFPMNTLINLSNYIIDLYQHLEENNLTDSEKSLINRTFYNLGLFYYLDGKKDKALLSLSQAKDRIINSEENEIIDTSFFNINIKKKDSLAMYYPKNTEKNLFSRNTLDEIPVIKRLSTKRSFIENTKSNIFININDERAKKENQKNKARKSTTIQKISKGLSKNNNNLEDIKLLINYGVKNGLITEKNKKENEHRNKYRKFFRGSHINLSTTFRVKDFIIPYYFNNPLIRKIELLMGEIELDKKNYISAYYHVLRAFYILISLKINRTCGNQTEFINEQKVIDKYLTLIEKYKEEEIKNNEKQKSEFNMRETFGIFSVNSNIDSFQENIKEELNDIVLDKYNLNYEENEESEDDNQEILVCGQSAQDDKMLKEIEKFFLFLTSLSLFQIKVLNETQPDNAKRNDLPILFPSQFKDCLSNIQRIELGKLEIMALSRYTILKDPNKWIMPNNVNIDIIQKNKYKEIKENQMKKLQKKEKLNYTSIKESREYKYYQKILFSEKSNKEIRDFLNMNFDLVIKILKKSTIEEIQNIINFPYIIMGPVKNFKKKKKKKLQRQGHDITNFDDIVYNHLLYNRDNYDYDCNDNNLGIKEKRTFSTRFKSNKIGDYNYFHKNLLKRNQERFSERNRNRNKSVYNKFSLRLKKISEEDKIFDMKDYNDSYEDILISLDNSSDKKC